ncbi:hypothetical protein CRUP_031696 [Coryphaenoides rupestris]|nr:hypothetical protein CRUP_031696 [Coryphaenoides rupestris]
MFNTTLPAEDFTLRWGDGTAPWIEGPLAPLGNGTNGRNCTKNDGFKYPLYSVVFSMVFVVGLLTNVVAMYIFMCSLKLRNETTTYMMNLVVSDLLFVLTLPLRVYYFVNQNWPFKSVLCKLSVSLFYTNMYGSILFLTCISVDRFLAIVYPLRSRWLRTKRNAKIVCAAVWVLVLAGSLPTGFKLQSTTVQDDRNIACFENFSSSQWKLHLSKMVIFIETVGFFIPLLLNVVCSVMVLQTLRRPQALGRGSKLNKTKILLMIVVHLSIFCFCFVPYNVNLVFYALVRTNTLQGCSAESVVRTIYPIALCLAVSNCCFDPIVYYFTSETIQNSIKRKSQGARSDIKFSETLQSESSSQLQCNLCSLKAKVFHNESSV